MEYTIGSRVFGDWTIVRAIGEGSFGKVFEIQKTDYGITTRSALKVISVPRSQADIRAALGDGMDERSVTTYFQGFVEEIVKEIAIMSSLKSHPGIVSCEDHKVMAHSGTIGWDILIRMELLQALTDYQLSHTMDEQAVHKMAIDLTAALAFCQTKALIHRDIKPENIFVSETGHFKLGDFGVARTAEKTTGGLSKKGTESYMAPEVYLARPYGATVDIYSLGLVLYKFLNYNRLPFLPPYPAPISFADRENAMVQRVQGVPLPPPAAASPAFAAIILKACAYNPEDRYHTAAEMLADLEKLTLSPMQQEAAQAGSQPLEDAFKDQTVGIWGRSFDETTQGTVGIWDAKTPAQPADSFRNDPPEPSYAPSQPQPSYIPPAQTPPEPQEAPMPSYIPTPPAPAKKGVSKLLIGGIAAAVLVVIVVAVVLISTGSGSGSTTSYQAQQESSVSYYDYDDSSEESSADPVIIEESSQETETSQEVLVLDEDAQLWDDAMMQMFDPIAASYLTAGGLDLLSGSMTPDALCNELLSYNFLFLQPDGSYSSTPYYYDAVNSDTGAADLKYCAAVPPGGHTLKRTRDVGKIYVVTDPSQTYIAHLKWIWADDNAESETILADTAFSSFLPWADSLGNWQYDDAFNNAYTDSSMHNWLMDQPETVYLNYFDLAYYVALDEENGTDEKRTLMIAPNLQYLEETGHAFAWIDVTNDEITTGKMTHALTIVYDGNYDPFVYPLEDFWDPAMIAPIADEDFQYQWTLAANNALESLETTLGVSSIDYNASLTDLYAAFQAQQSGYFGMTELLSDESWDYFGVIYNSATIAVYDEKTSSGSHREIYFYYDPSCDTAAYDLAFLNSFLPPVGYQLGQTPADAFAAFGVSQELYDSTSETLSYSWWDVEPTPQYEYHLSTNSTFYMDDAAYYTDPWLEKDVVDHRILRLTLNFDSVTYNQVEFESGYFNNAAQPTIYQVGYVIQK